jgi:hypothetical protein
MTTLPNPDARANAGRIEPTLAPDPSPSTPEAPESPQIANYPPSANLQDTPTRAERFHAVDAWLRDYEERTKDWALLAKMCIDCETEELWREGPFSSWDDWLHKSGPRSARAVYYHKAVYLGLLPDFSLEEMREMRPETAKELRKCSTAARRDPAVRELARTKKPGDFVSSVNELHPDQHLENTVKVTFHFEPGFIPVYEEFLAGVRLLEDDPGLERERCIELAIIAWLNAPWGDGECTNSQRFNRLKAGGE